MLSPSPPLMPAAEFMRQQAKRRHAAAPSQQAAEGDRREER